MIFPVLLIALLCAEAASSDTELRVCDEWACFVPPSCLEGGGSGTILITDFSEDPKIKDTCSGFMMIKPASTKRWKVVIGWTNPATTEVTVSQGTTELFSCKNATHNGKYIGLTAISAGLSFEKALPTPEMLFHPKPFTCEFYIGDGKTEVIQTKSELMWLDSPEEKNKIKDGQFIQIVTSKIMCDFTKILFDSAALPEDVIEPAVAGGSLLTCWGYNGLFSKGFKLQYKIGSVYEDVTASMSVAHCLQDSETLIYEYHIETKSGMHIKTDEFYARCYAKRCAICDKPNTPEGKIAPTFATGADGCRTLACPKFFRVGTEVAFGKAECTQGTVNNWYWNWAIGSMKLNGPTDCVDEMFCKKINQSSCSGDCKLNPNTTFPYCPDTLALSANIDGEELRGIGHIECHTHEGRLYYSGKVNGYFPRDPSNVTFSCVEKPATSFYRTTLFRDIFSAVAGICIALIFPMLYGIVWLIREIRKLLAERRGEVKKAPKANEKTQKTAEKTLKTAEKTAKK